MHLQFLPAISVTNWILTTALMYPGTVSQVDRLLSAADKSFYFNVFALEEATFGHALSVLAFFLLNRTGLASTFGLNLCQLARFLRRLEAGYSRAVPYHNAIHVADVLQVRL